jgi:hypothetical protein
VASASPQFGDVFYHSARAAPAVGELRSEHDFRDEALAEMLSSRLDRPSMAPLPGLAAIAPRLFLNVEL